MSEKKQEQENRAWEGVALVCLGLTIAGQIIIGGWYLFGMGLWLVSNVLFLTRDFVLKRPKSDKVKDAALTAITAGLIVSALL